MTNFDKVAEVIGEARGIAWDTCHKIYILMDNDQMKLMESYGYDPLIYADEMPTNELLDTVKMWYENSCVLRFVDAVWSSTDEHEDRFEPLITQFEDQEDEDEYDDDEEE